MSSPLDGLPSAMRALLSGLETELFPPEVLATCSHCAMAPGRPERVALRAPARCCTYQPNLPNFLVGRALAQGGTGAERLRGQMHTANAMGIPRSDAYQALYERRLYDEVGYGNDEALTCPYWEEGRCTIHASREAVCRTWYCKLAHGARGARVMAALKEALQEAEGVLARACLAEGSPPAPGSSAEEWEAWFRACAAYVDSLEVENPVDVERIRAAVQERERPLPEVVGVNLRHWQRETEGWGVSAWSSYDLVDVPPWIFEFFSRLDGQRSWRDVQLELGRQTGHWISDDLVLSLWRRGVLATPEEPKDTTELLITPG